MTHTSEKRWQRNQDGNGLNQEVADLSGAMLDVLSRAEKLGLELEELVDYTSDGKKDSIQAIANQLFNEDWINRESDPIGEPGVLDDRANEFECQKISDAVGAINAAREIFEFANTAEKNDRSRLSTLRRMG